jgi:hypothetical protein
MHVEMRNPPIHMKLWLMSDDLDHRVTRTPKTLHRTLTEYPEFVRGFSQYPNRDPE